MAFILVAANFVRFLRRPDIKVTHRTISGGRIMNTSYGTAGFAIKAGYFLLAAVVVVFVGMLVLTVLHP